LFNFILVVLKGTRGKKLKIIKKQKRDASETVITVEYSEWTQDLENIVSYIEGQKKTIQGYGENKEVHNILIEKILYFEAVGELVFAYTKDNVYEIKMRLYQVEQVLQNSPVHRASKSILVNIKRIENLRSALNGRIIATMENGEEILITRSYSKEIVAIIREY